jgi:hypothetical protein
VHASAVDESGVAAALLMSVQGHCGFGFVSCCRLRASAQPRLQAYREAGWETSGDDDAYSNACRLERRPGVRQRIEYLSRQDEELIAEKRRRIEEQLWSIHEADIGDYFEVHEIDGKIIERPKRLADFPSEIRKNIEKVTIDGRGRAVP